MKLKQTKLLPYIFLIFFVFFTTYIWDKIKIPFPDVDIIGTYSKNNHNSLNEILRYLIFISLPHPPLYCAKEIVPSPVALRGEPLLAA